MSVDIAELGVGDRVRCTAPLNDGSLGLNMDLVGVEGEVVWVGQFVDPLTSQVAVNWDNGSRLNLLPGDPVERVCQLAGWVVPPCQECAAPGDVECQADCSQAEFRQAEFDGVLEQE